MDFPNFKNKHLERALFHAEDFVKYRKYKKSLFPKKYVVIWQRTPLKYFLRKYRGKYKKVPLSRGVFIYKIGNVGIIRIPGIGSPHVITTIEELSALGAKEFISIGTAGGLQKEGFFLIDRAIRDEGTSHHYIGPGKYSYSHKILTNKLGKCLEKKGIQYERATTWTVDAPYRETKSVATVDMEASALFAVIKAKKLKIATAFAVSDLLIKKWEPKFHTMNLKKSLNQLLEAAIDCLRKK